MPSPVPTPVAAALGIVPTVLGGVRNLPGKAVQLPIYALSTALTGIGTARREYDLLAERGERLIAKLRGTSFDELEDRFEDSLKGTRLATPYDKVEDALEDAADTVTAFVRTAPAKVRQAPVKARKAAGAAAKSAGDGLDKAATTVEDLSVVAAGAADEIADPTQDLAAVRPAAEEPKTEATPKATQPDTTRVETAAAADVVETVEKVADQVGGEPLAHDDLPLPDYDHLTLGSLRGRMRSLDLPQLVALREYEKAHAARLPIVTMFDNRIAKLATDPATTPSSGGGAEPVPAPAASGGSKVSPATAAPTLPTASRGGLGDQNRPR